MSDNATITRAQANIVLREIGIKENVYFQALSRGEMSLACFRQSQEQFYFAVAHYAQPIASLISRIKDPAKRSKLLNNLLDEHGNLNESACHQNTFKDFLTVLGSNNLSAVRPSAPVLSFNNALSGACSFEEPSVGLSCLGIIEYAFADISALIAKEIVGQNWVSASKLCHYSLHADLDIEHAQDLFSSVESTWDIPEQRVYTEQGLNLGAYLFNRLYTDLYYSKKENDDAYSIYDKIRLKRLQLGIIR